MFVMLCFPYRLYSASVGLSLCIGLCTVLISSLGIEVSLRITIEFCMSRFCVIYIVCEQGDSGEQ